MLHSFLSSKSYYEGSLQVYSRILRRGRLKSLDLPQVRINVIDTNEDQAEDVGCVYPFPFRIKSTDNLFNNGFHRKADAGETLKALIGQKLKICGEGKFLFFNYIM